MLSFQGLLNQGILIKCVHLRLGNCNLQFKKRYNICYDKCCNHVKACLAMLSSARPPDQCVCVRLTTVTCSSNSVTHLHIRAAYNHPGKNVKFYADFKASSPVVLLGRT
jgi:hypothetical protein